MPYDRETPHLLLMCRLKDGSWLYIPAGWWHVAEPQATSIHLSIGVTPVVRLKLFEFLKQCLSGTTFWCYRVAWSQPDEADSPVLKDPDRRLCGGYACAAQQCPHTRTDDSGVYAYLVETKSTERTVAPGNAPGYQLGDVSDQLVDS